MPAGDARRASLSSATFELDAAHPFFRLVGRHKDHDSTLVTSTRNVAQWDRTFGDGVKASDILNRLLHHGQVITIRGESYGLQE